MEITSSTGVASIAFAGVVFMLMQTCNKESLSATISVVGIENDAATVSIYFKHQVNENSRTSKATVGTAILFFGERLASLVRG